MYNMTIIKNQQKEQYHNKNNKIQQNKKDNFKDIKDIQDKHIIVLLIKHFHMDNKKIMINI